MKQTYIDVIGEQSILQNFRNRTVIKLIIIHIL